MWGAPYLAWFKITTTVLGLAPILHTLGAMAAVFLAFFIRVNLLDKLLVFIGKHSGDIYLTHWLFYTVFLSVIQINIWIIQYVFVVFLSVMLGFSIGKLKELLKYKDFYKVIINKI